MSYIIIPLSIIGVCFLVIISIVVRKFSALANLNVDSIPAEKEIQFKERIIGNRLKRNILKWNSKAMRVFQFLSGQVGKGFNALYEKLKKMQEENSQKRLATTLLDENGTGYQTKMEQMFQEIERLKKREEYGQAEKRLIEIISHDSKNIKAFKMLAQVYVEKKEYEDARQTLEHILKMKEDDEEVYDNLAQIERDRGNFGRAKEEYIRSLNINAERSQTYFNLAQVAIAMSETDDAIKNIKKALKVEPNNPRFLDTMIEISIMKKDKIAALDAYEKLSKTNPENQKLADFKKEIDLL